MNPSIRPSGLLEAGTKKRPKTSLQCSVCGVPLSFGSKGNLFKSRCEHRNSSPFVLYHVFSSYQNVRDCCQKMYANAFLHSSCTFYILLHTEDKRLLQADPEMKEAEEKGALTN